jgi:hypothetical protein
MRKNRFIKRFAAGLLAAGLGFSFAACGSGASSASSASSASHAATVTESAKDSTSASGAETVSASSQASSINASSTADTGSATLADGTYDADFTTDSKMFHVNEALDGKGKLTVKDGKMTIHISLASENIVNLFEGTAEDAQKEGAQLIEPTTDTVKYGDGTTEEVYGFDVPVPALDQEFDLALIGTKGKWYDHKVKVSNPVAAEDETAG